MNPYQDVIDWLRSPEGSSWSEQRMRKAVMKAFDLDGSGSMWNLNRMTGDTMDSPLYLGGVLSVKEDDECE